MTGKRPRFTEVKVKGICPNARVANRLCDGIPDTVSWQCSVSDKDPCPYLKDLSILCAVRDGIVQESKERQT